MSFATANTLSKSQIILEWDERDGDIVVVPSDEDRFMLKVGHAIEILKSATGKVDRFQRQLNFLLKTLAIWLKDAQGVERAMLTLRDGALLFVVVRKSGAYSDDFDDSLSDLDFDVANDEDLDLIEMNAIALPSSSSDAIDSFLDSSFILEYSGHVS